MYMERLREVALFSPQERWLRGYLFVVFCFTKGGIEQTLLIYAQPTVRR